MTEDVALRTEREAEIVRLARGWIGTPYHHQASVKGVGCDCLGLIRGVYRELMGREAATPPPYSRDWGEANGEETLIRAASQHLTPISLDELRPGAVLVFRLRPTAIAKHAGLMVTPGTFVHAMEGSLAHEAMLSPWWHRRIAEAFIFPN